jgi:hypothetical protein
VHGVDRVAVLPRSSNAELQGDAVAPAADRNSSPPDWCGSRESRAVLGRWDSSKRDDALRSALHSRKRYAPTRQTPSADRTSWQKRYFPAWPLSASYPPWLSLTSAPTDKGTSCRRESQLWSCCSGLRPRPPRRPAPGGECRLALRRAGLKGQHTSGRRPLLPVAKPRTCPLLIALGRCPLLPTVAATATSPATTRFFTTPVAIGRFSPKATSPAVSLLGAILPGRPTFLDASGSRSKTFAARSNIGAQEHEIDAA